jgi:uncharacterized membrane protein YfcA
VLGIAGSFAGARLSASIRPSLLLTLFAVLMLAAAAAMLHRRRSPAGQPPPVTQPVPSGLPPPDGTATSAPGGRARAATLERPPAAARPGTRAAAWWRPRGVTRRQVLKVAAAATGVGLLTGFFGVGGGFVIVPALVLALGFEMPAAVGTSLLVISVNSASALAVRLSGGVSLDWRLLGVFTLAALAGTLAGNRLASRVSASRLTAAFTGLLIAVAVYSLCRSVPALM